MGKQLFSITGLIVALVLFIGVNQFSETALRKMRVDLTQNGLYSLSEGSQNILGKLDEPLDLKFFYSKSSAPDGSPIPAYAQRVRELLEEYEAKADSMVRLEIIHTEPFSESEDAATQAGLSGFRINEAGDRLFFGLVGTNSVDDTEVIPFFEPSRESSLEYDITQLIYRLGTEERPLIGVLSSLPMDGGGPDPRTGQPGPRWAILDYISQTQEVRTLEPTLTGVDAEVDVLMLVHPQGLPDTALYAIDQFALRGGRILAFVDPHSWFQPVDPSDPRGAMSADRSSHMESLLTAWGVAMDTQSIAGDQNKAQQVAAGVFLQVFLGLDSDCLDEEDFTTRGLSSVKMLTPGAFVALDNSTLTLDSLMRTTEEGAGAMDATMLQMGMQDPTRMVEMFAPSGAPADLAIRIHGDSVPSAFPDGAPALPEGTETDERPTHLSASSAPFHAVLVADTDMLSDQLWVQRMGPYLMPNTGNGSFVVNVLENLSGSTDLIGLRSREGFARPFHKKAELEMAARERLQTKQDELEAEIRQTEDRLAALQAPGEAAGGLLLDDAQTEELEKLQETMLLQRKESREVRRQLNSEIKALGTRLKIFNTLLVPALLLILALLTAANGKRTRKSS
ncbi:MAG: Gldg family protein [Planctomycetota bacterium]|nr:Gldg family protein [Planctomycetota bacterium]